MVNGETTLTNKGTVISASQSLYNAKGQMEKSVSATGQTTEFVYDSFGRQVATVSQAVAINGVVERHRTETVYVSNSRASQQISNIIQLVDGTLDRTHQQTVTSIFDEFGRQLKTTFDDGSFVRSEFDQLNQSKAST